MSRHEIHQVAATTVAATMAKAMAEHISTQVNHYLWISIKKVLRSAKVDLGFKLLTLASPLICKRSDPNNELEKSIASFSR